MTWLIVAYAIGTLTTAAIVAVWDEWTSDWRWGRLPRLIHAAIAMGWPIALLVMLVWCLAYGFTVLPNRFGTWLAKKYKLKRMKETNGI